MSKISSDVSNGLGNAIKEAQELLNSGVKAERKRKKKEKAEEIIVENKTENEPSDNSLFEALGVTLEEEAKEEDNRPEWEKRSHRSFEEFCQWEIDKAHYYNKPDPDFDFRNYYAKGQVIYFVRVAEILGEKEIMRLTLRTVYPRNMVGYLDKAYCECLCMQDKDMIFLNHTDALQCFNSIQINSRNGDEYDETTGLKKRKKKIKEDSKEDNINDYIDIPEEDE